MPCLGLHQVELVLRVHEKVLLLQLKLQLRKLVNMHKSVESKILKYVSRALGLAGNLLYVL